MKAMKSRDRILAVLEGSGVDQVPLYPPFQGYWALGIANLPVPLTIRKPKLGAEAQIKAAERFGFDGIEASGDCFMPPVEALGCEVKQPDIGSGSTTFPIIIEHGDLDKLEIPDIRLDHRTMSHTIATEYLMEKVGKEKFIQMSTIGPFTLVGELRGVETFMLDTLMDEEFVYEMLRFTTDVVKMYIEYMGGLGVEGISPCDPTASGSLISREDFERFCLPTLKECDKVIKKSGAKDILHICGDTSNRLDLVMSAKADIFSIDYQVDLKVAFEKVGRAQAILGNVRPPHALFSGTPEMVLEESLACIDKSKGYRFFLGAGCDIPPGSPEENVMMMSKAVKMRKGKA